MKKKIVAPFVQKQFIGLGHPFQSIQEDVIITCFYLPSITEVMWEEKKNFNYSLGYWIDLRWV